MQTQNDYVVAMRDGGHGARAHSFTRPYHLRMVWHMTQPPAIPSDTLNVSEEITASRSPIIYTEEVVLFQDRRLFEVVRDFS